MASNKSDNLVITIPNNKHLVDSTLNFMQKSGFRINRSNPRQLGAEVERKEDIIIRFQRAEDIPSQVDDGDTDLGITGLDLFEEHKREEGNAILIHDKLGFGKCQLVLAVRDDWFDVTTMADIAEISIKWHDGGLGNLKVATSFKNLTRKYLNKYGVYYFEIVETHGAIELAPNAGLAHIISDLMETGTTLRENRLKLIADGKIMDTQACLIGNKKNLKKYEKKLLLTRNVIEYFESQIRAEGFYSVVANIHGDSPKKVYESLINNGRAKGLRGPTISKVYTKDKNEKWYAINIVVHQNELFPVIEHLREINSEGILVFPSEYIFENESETYKNLIKKVFPKKYK